MGLKNKNLKKLCSEIKFNSPPNIVTYNSVKYILYNIPPKCFITSSSYNAHNPYYILDGLPSYGYYDKFKKFIFKKKIINDKVLLNKNNVLYTHPKKNTYMYQYYDEDIDKR
jgi:hypothetical protein